MDNLEIKTEFNTAFERVKIRPEFQGIRDELKEGIFRKLSEETNPRFVNGELELFNPKDENLPLFDGAKKVTLSGWVSDKMKTWSESIPEVRTIKKAEEKPYNHKNQMMRDLQKSRRDFDL